jgi:hypothetical protein
MSEVLYKGYVIRTQTGSVKSKASLFTKNGKYTGISFYKDTLEEAIEEVKRKLDERVSPTRLLQLTQ